MKEFIGAIVIVFCIPVLVYLVFVFLPWAIGKHEVFSPEEGVKCVVVSRGFHTSVDCWKESTPGPQ